MIRVLMVAIKFPPYFAGAAVQAVHLAKELQRQGVSVEFITDNDERKSVNDVYEGLNVYRFSTFFKKESKLKELIYVARIFIYILRNHRRFDVVHFHSMRGVDGILFPLCRALGKKVVLKVTLVDNDDPLAFSRRKIGPLIRWAQRYVDRFAVISTALRKNCLAAGVPEGRVQVIYNGVNTRKFTKPSAEEKRRLKEKTGFGAFNRLFLSIGQIEHRKGYDLLLDAWPEISAAFPDSALVIAGPGAEETNPFYVYLKKRIDKAGMRNVFFPGHVSDSAEYMRIADCFLFCSRAEGFGTVLIEAMASEVPVIAMNIPDVTGDILRDRRIGRICYSRQPDEMAQETLELISEINFDAVTEASKEVRRFFGIERIAEIYIDLYERLLGIARPRTIVKAEPELAIK